jgi:hypothetical protein|tara:strand:- start:1062 stop:1211 length:150 start_codon:yes stop_codon:yes gene_type:complete
MPFITALLKLTAVNNRIIFPDVGLAGLLTADYNEVTADSDKYLADSTTT